MARASKSSSGPGRIIVGLAGWSYPDWSGIVYPARRLRGFHEATYLAQYFDAIEVNTSFYQPLRPAVAAQWLERVAANPRFVFTAKLWQKFTHETGATADDERLVRTASRHCMPRTGWRQCCCSFPFPSIVPRRMSRG